MSCNVMQPMAALGVAQGQCLCKSRAHCQERVAALHPGCCTAARAPPCARALCEAVTAHTYTGSGTSSHRAPSFDTSASQMVGKQNLPHMLLRNTSMHVDVQVLQGCLHHCCHPTTMHLRHRGCGPHTACPRDHMLGQWYVRAHQAWLRTAQAGRTPRPAGYRPGACGLARQARRARHRGARPLQAHARPALGQRRVSFAAVACRGCREHPPQCLLWARG